MFSFKMCSCAAIYHGNQAWNRSFNYKIHDLVKTNAIATEECTWKRTDSSINPPGDGSFKFHSVPIAFLFFVLLCFWAISGQVWPQKFGLNSKVSPTIENQIEYSIPKVDQNDPQISMWALLSCWSFFVAVAAATLCNSVESSSRHIMTNLTVFSAFVLICQIHFCRYLRHSQHKNRLLSQPNCSKLLS